MNVDSFARAFEPFRHLDPAGWIGVFRVLPPWAAALCIILGSGLLLRGTGLLFRVVAGPLGFLYGQLWIGPLVAHLGFVHLQHQVALWASFIFLTVGIAAPVSTVFLGLGLPIGLVVANLTGPSNWLLGFVPAFIIGGALGVVLERPLSVLLASVAGGFMLTVGGMAGLSLLVPTFVDQFADWPVATSVWLCIAAAGAGYELFVLPSPEKRAALRGEKAIAKRTARERRAIENRWATYTKSSARD